MNTETETEVIRELDRIGNDVNRFATAQKDRIAAVDKKQDELRAQVFDLQQRAVRRGGSDSPIGSAGLDELRSTIEASSELQAVADSRSRRAVLDLPSGFFAPRSAITSVGIAMPDRQDAIVGPPGRRVTIRSLLPSAPTTAGSVQYSQETGYTNNAAPVSEGALKPETGLVFTLKTAVVATIAHWTKASVQVLADAPMLAEYIGNRLRTGLSYIEDAQLLLGSGTGNNLRGLMTDATAFSGSTVGTRIDVLRRAMTQLEIQNFEPSGLVLHPADWEAIVLTKDSDGGYIVGAPTGRNPATLWNLPVVSTSAMTQGSFLAADFAQAALVLDRQQARIDVSTEDEVNFQRNLATIRCEERLGLAIFRPLALVKGTFA